MRTRPIHLFKRLSLLVLLLSFNAAFAQTYYSQGSGDFNNLSNWSTAVGGGGTSPVSIVNQTGTFIIQAGHEIVVNDSINIASLTVHGTVTFGNDATERSMWVNGNVTVEAIGTIQAGNFNAVHRLTVNGGDIINKGQFNLRTGGSNKVVDLYTRGDVVIHGPVTPILSNLTVGQGTTRASVDLNIKGHFVVLSSSTFNAATFTHHIAGNFTKVGTFVPGTSTVIFDSPLIQVITATSGTSEFHKLTVVSGGSLAISGNIRVANKFHVKDNSQVTTISSNIFNGDWHIENGSSYTATSGVAAFEGANPQDIRMEGSVEFAEMSFRNAGIKTIYGDVVANTVFRVRRGSHVVDGADGQTHTIGGVAILDGLCELRHKVIFKGYHIYCDHDYPKDITFGLADLVIEGNAWIGANSTLVANLVVNGNLDINSGHLVIRDGASLRGIASKALNQNEGNLYVRGADNYPTGFGSYNHNAGVVIYDGDLEVQKVRGGVDYYSLYLSRPGDGSVATKELEGSININRHLIFAPTKNSLVTFNVGNYDVNLKGNLDDNFKAEDNRRCAIVQTGGTFKLCGDDIDQVFYRRNPNSYYSFYNLVIENVNPSSTRTKTFHGNGNDPYDDLVDLNIINKLEFVNESDNPSKSMVVNLRNIMLNGSSTAHFELGNNVVLSIESFRFTESVNSFNTLTLDPSSTVRYMGKDEYVVIPPLEYGNIEFGGESSTFYVYGINGLTVNGDISQVSGSTSKFRLYGVAPQQNQNHKIKGNWNLSSSAVDASTPGTGRPTVTFNGTGDQYIRSSNFVNIAFSGSGNKVLTGSVIVSGNLDIGNSVVVDAGVHSITLGGHWSNMSDGIFKGANVCAVTFNGTSDQDVSVQYGDLSKFSNFRIDKAPNTFVNVLSDITIDGEMVVLPNKGGLNLNNHTVTVGGHWKMLYGSKLNWIDGAKLVFNSNDQGQSLSNYAEGLRYPTLEFEGSGAKRLLDNPFHIDGDLILRGAVVRGEWTPHYLKGNFINNGGIFQHGGILYFNGADQTIDASEFGSMYFDGEGTKKLNGNISLLYHLTIGAKATLDVSPDNGSTSYNITLNGNWNNNEWTEDKSSTGKFIARKGTVTFVGNDANIYTGDSISADHVGREGKSFYNMVINKKNIETYARLFPRTPVNQPRIRLANDLRVQNNFTLQQGIFYNYWDNMYVGGNMYVTGRYRMLASYSLYPKLFFEGNNAVLEIDPGVESQYRKIEFIGNAEYKLKGDWKIERDIARPNFVISGGKLTLNGNALSLDDTGFGDLLVDVAGELVIDSASELRMANSRKIENRGVLRLVGVPTAPATMRSVSGTFSFIQKSGVFHAKNYLIANTRGLGIEIDGGTIDPVNNFSNGLFSAGIGDYYLTIRPASPINTPMTIANVVFHTGPAKNVARLTNTGTAKMTFVNASGPLQGEAYEKDDYNLVDWVYSGAKRWTGAAGDGLWSTAGNWSDGAIPDESTKVILDNTHVTGAYTVTVNSNAQAASLSIEGTATTVVLNNAMLDIKGNIDIFNNNILKQIQPADTIIVGGSWTNAGRHIPNQSTVKFTAIMGTNTITNPQSSNKFYNVVVSGMGGENSLLGDIAVDGHIQLINGTLNALSNTIEVYGDWTAYPETFEGGTGRVVFKRNDATPQYINGGTFTTIEFSGSSVKYANETLVVKEALVINRNSQFNAGEQTLYIGRRWINGAGNTGFVQTGAGRVVFNYVGSSLIGDENTTEPQPTTFNHLYCQSTGTIHVYKDVNIKGSLYNAPGSNIWIGGEGRHLGAKLSGMSGSVFTMAGGALFIYGHDRFPSGFATYELTGGYVEYRGNRDQIVRGGADVKYNVLYLRTLPNTTTRLPLSTKKVVGGDLYVKDGLAVINVYEGIDAPVQLDMDNHDMYIESRISLQSPIDSTLRQVKWGTGTVYFDGPSIDIHVNTKEFNNIVKRGTGNITLKNHITIHGNFTLSDNTGLVMDTCKAVCDGANKNFVAGAGTWIYSKLFDKGAQINYAFPTGFTNYSIDITSKYYLNGSSNQSILPGVTYGQIDITENNAREVHLRGELNVRNNFRNHNDLTKLVDNGYDMRLGGFYNDLKNYQATNTVYLDGTGEQRIYAGGAYTSVYLNKLVTSNGGVKLLAEDTYHISGGINVGENDTLKTHQTVFFSGDSLVNKGRFEHLGNKFNFVGNNQVIDPGDNSFNEVFFQSTATCKFVNTGINIRETLKVGEDHQHTVDFGSVTHYIGSPSFEVAEEFVETQNANFVFDRNGTQHLYQFAANNVTLTTVGDRAVSKHFYGLINVNDLHISDKVNLYVGSQQVLADVTVRGNFINEGRFYAPAGTFFFESDNTDTKTIKTSGSSFFTVEFNKTHTENRQYTLIDNVVVKDNLTLNQGAYLKTGGNKVNIGDNDTDMPEGEKLTIKAGATLELDANSDLVFDINDLSPTFDIYGTLKVLGTGSQVSTIKASRDASSMNRGIKMKAYSGANLEFKNYAISDLDHNGFVIENGVNIHNTNNFSYGLWRGMYVGSIYTDSEDPSITHDKFYYMQISANTSGLSNIENVQFEHGTTPVRGRHFNVSRPAGCTGNINFTGETGGNIGVEEYELDPNSQVNWPVVSRVTWTGKVNSNWFVSGNWSPAVVPDENTDAYIPRISDGGANPEISADGAICKNLMLTGGYLSINDGVNQFTVRGHFNVEVNSTLIIVDEATIEVNGNWKVVSNVNFLAGRSTILFTRDVGTSIIEHKASSSFYGVHFGGLGAYSINGLEYNFEGDFIIDGGTVSPTTENYKFNIKGNYALNSGSFSTTLKGTFIFKGQNQTIKNGRFNKLEIESGTTTFIDSTHLYYFTSSSADFTLHVKPNARFVMGAGSSIVSEGNVLFATGSHFIDNGQTFFHRGAYWYGKGNVNLTGLVHFCGEYQAIAFGSFANLLFTNKPGFNTYKSLNNDITVTGDVEINSTNFLMKTSTITNTTGNGTFKLGETTVSVTGADNYPKGFSEFEVSDNSSTVYEGVIDQIIRGKTVGSNVNYGRLYLKKNSKKTLEGDIHVVSLIFNEGRTTLDANNNTITLTKDWTTSVASTFYPRQGEVIFAGSTDQVISLHASSSNDFYKLRLNMENTAAHLRVTSNVNIHDKLWVRSGLFNLYDSRVAIIGGDLVASNSGKFTGGGQYVLVKNIGQANIQGNNSVFTNLFINGSAKFNITDNFTVSALFEINNGEVHINGNTLTLGVYSNTANVRGKLFTDPGGTIKIGNLSTFNVLNGGEVHIVGSFENIATVTRSENGAYYFNVENGGKIHARHYLFEYMNLPGIHIKPGAMIDMVNNFSFGTFSNPATGGTCLRIENNQTFNKSDSIVNIFFPVNPGHSTVNIAKTSSTGVIDIYQWSGSLAGPNFELDDYNLLNWKTGNTIVWVGGHGAGASRYSWNVPENWDLGRLPQTTDNVVINNTGYTCYLRDMPDTVTINNLTVKGPLYLVKDAAADRRVLNVSGNIDLQESLVFDGDSTKIRFLNDYQSSQISNISAPNGGTVGVYGTGVSVLSSSITNDNIILEIEKDGVVSIPSRYNRVKSLKISETATVSLSYPNTTGDFTVLGSFINYGTFEQNQLLLKLGSPGNHRLLIKNSPLIEVQFLAGKYSVENETLQLRGNVTIDNGAELDVNGKTINFGGLSTSRLMQVSGKLNFGDFGHAIFTPGSKLFVKNGGVLTMLGDLNKDVVFTRQGNGRYEVVIENGGKIVANYYKFEYLHANGVILESSAIIDDTYNLSNGVFIYGDPNGCYLDFRNNFTDSIMIRNVNFSEDVKYNARRKGALLTGVINFRDAYGLKANPLFEDDDASPYTGKIVWTYTIPTLFWTGAVDTKWDNPQNWNPNAIPSNDAIIFLRPGAPRYPIVNSTYTNSTINIKRITLYNGASMTMSDGKSLTTREDFINAGTFTISNGSNTTIKVGGVFANNGTFNHGGASTLELAAVDDMELTFGTATVFNLKLNSNDGAGNSIFQTRSSISIQGDLTINAGILKVSHPSHSIFVGRHFTNNSGFVHGNGALIMNGNVNQELRINNGDKLYDLTLSGNGIKSLKSDIFIANKITIGATFNANDKIIDIGGDWRGNRLFNKGTSTVRFIGNKPQLISKAELFHNVVINNTAALSAVTLQNIVRVANNITLIKGKIESGNNNTLTILDNATITGAGQQSYVVGYVVKEGNDDFVFPVGSDNIYAPMGISGITSSSRFKAGYFETAYNPTIVQPGLNKVSNIEHWQFNRLAGNAKPYVTFYWNDGERSRIEDLDPIAAAVYQSGRGWKSMGKGSTTGDINVGSVTSASQFDTFGYCGFGWTYGLIKWEGTVSEEWENSNNWHNNSLPTTSTNVLIEAGKARYPSVASNASCFDLLIANGASLNITNGFTLNVLGNTKIETGGELSINSGGQLRASSDFANLGDMNSDLGSTLVFNGTTGQDIVNAVGHNVVFSGVGNKNIIGNIQIKGNVSISSNVYGKTSTISVGGNWNQPSGRFHPENSTVILNGLDKQTLTSSSQVNFWNLTVDNQHSEKPQISLSSNILIRGHLQLNKGVVNSKNTSILSVEESATASSGNAESFVSGPMRRFGIQNFVFPLGKGDRWARIGISDMAGSGAFLAEYFNAPYSNVTNLQTGLVRVSSIEYWNLERSGGSGTAQPKVTLYWENKKKSGINSLTSLVVAHYRSGMWIGHGGTGIWNTADSLNPGSIKSAEAISSFSPFTFGSTSEDDNPLPIQLINFTASTTNRMSVTTEWVTATEFNNDRFELERSLDGVNFEHVATVRSKGNSSSITNYSFEDVTPYKGTSYYRLKQVDLDGMFTVYPMVSVYLSGEINVDSYLYPNPTSSNCSIEFNQHLNQKVVVSIHNITGQLVGYQEFYLNGIKTLELSEHTQQLGPGVYYVNITTDGHNRTHKLIIK